MAITQASIGSYDGKPVTAYTLTNKNGAIARVISFGARLTQMHVPDRDGRMADIVLGFDDLEPYFDTDTYFGATCGRYGNRIKDAQFALDGETVHVTANEPPNHLHGGLRGFDKQVWTAMIHDAENAVTFSLVSENRSEGFPGELLLKSKYILTDDNRLLLTMSGVSDKPTILNMVHHSYWNVGGHNSGSVAGHLLQVDGDFYTPVDEQLLATGEVLAVAGSPFDFRQSKPIGRDIQAIKNAGFGRLAGDADGDEGGGYDHNWVLRKSGSGLQPVATLQDPATGRGLSIRSTEPGVQIYSGGYLNPSVVGKGGHAYCKYAGLTFETQKFPGSPNFGHFPSTRLLPGEVYEHRMEIQFFAR